jgi:hypothetical protein
MGGLPDRCRSTSVGAFSDEPASCFMLARFTGKEEKMLMHGFNLINVLARLGRTFINVTIIIHL